MGPRCRPDRSLSTVRTRVENLDCPKETRDKAWVGSMAFSPVVLIGSGVDLQVREDPSATRLCVSANHVFSAYSSLDFDFQFCAGRSGSVSLQTFPSLQVHTTSILFPETCSTAETEYGHGHVAEPTIVDRIDYCYLGTACDQILTKSCRW